MKRLLLAAFVICAPSLLASDLTGVIDHVLKAYGGEAAWGRVNSIRETGIVSSPMRPAPGKVTREWRRPDQLRIEVVYPTSTELRVVDGDKGTQNGKEASGTGLDAMRLQAARIALPALLSSKRSVCRDLGTHDQIRLIEIPLGGAMTLTVEIEPESGHIVRSVGRSSSIEFAATYSNFHKSGDVLFAFSEDTYAQGIKTATTTLTGIEINPSK